MNQIETFITQGFYFELFPIFVLGLLAGLAKFFQRDDDPDHDPTIRDFFYSAFSSVVICIIVYAILDSTDFSYLTRFAISGAIAFLGIDKALDLVQRLINLRNGGGNRHEVNKQNTHKEVRDYDD